ncbi:MAG: YitT family protein [Erysipelotrichia bacterium]|nr:YitT family protein [Candidatus Riflebacteria bacterium]NCB38699.1 YitT family protein [Erysipelotrichia bacterium]
MAKSSDAVRPLDIFYIVFGAFLLAFSLVAFTVPNKIAPGGLTGIATILYFTLKLPVGMTMLLGNVFLIGLQAYTIGSKTAWKTLSSIIITSILIEVMMNVFKCPPMTTNPILGCLYGGILSGIGIGLTFKAGGTSGGMDVVSQILHYRYRIPIGDVTLVSNVIVTLLAGYSFGAELALFGLITVFFTSKVIDAVLEGMSVFRTVFIISKQSDEIAWAIIEELRRGVTSLDAIGVYSGKPVGVLLTAVRRGELPVLRRLISEFDPKAFVIVGDARQIIGAGFTKIEDEVRFDKIENN